MSPARAAVPLLQLHSRRRALYHGDEPVDPIAGITDSPLPLTYTPRGVLLSDRNLTTGEPLELACHTFQTRGAPSSPSGRYALVRGNLVDFDTERARPGAPARRRADR
jgi:hypothetical protein